MEFEMVPCPVCGNPMPKKRQELGYKYCVKCSTEGRKVCIVEGTPEGDGVQSDIVIVTREQGRALNRANVLGGITRLETDDLPNTQTFEQQEVRLANDLELDRQFLPEEDFIPNTVDKLLQELEEILPIIDEEEDSNDAI